MTAQNLSYGQFPFIEEDDAVKIDAKMPNTALGRDAVTNIREGVFSGMSIEFQVQSLKGDVGTCGRSGRPFWGLRAWWMLAHTAAPRVEVRAEAEARAWED